MVAHSHPVRYSFREYIAHEEASNVKHEFLEGQIYAMAGGTPEHSALISSLNVHLGSRLLGTPCRIHMADLRIRVRSTGLATYPDLAIVRGPWERDPEDKNTIINPVVVVEVLSPNTEVYDRGEKLEHYKRIPSLRECVLVAHDRRAVEVWTRQGDGDAWVQSLHGPGERALLASIGQPIDFDAVYDAASEPHDHRRACAGPCAPAVPVALDNSVAGANR